MNLIYNLYTFNNNNNSKIITYTYILINEKK